MIPEDFVEYDNRLPEGMIIPTETVVYGGPFVWSVDGYGMPMFERKIDYDRRIDGERAVRFVAFDGSVLKEMTKERMLSMCQGRVCQPTPNR